LTPQHIILAPQQSLDFAGVAAGVVFSPARTAPVPTRMRKAQAMGQ
jgi:hypothetical protein